jgi:hypothetical protein
MIKYKGGDIMIKIGNKYLNEFGGVFKEDGSEYKPIVRSKHLSIKNCGQKRQDVLLWKLMNKYYWNDRIKIDNILYKDGNMYNLSFENIGFLDFEDDEELKPIKGYENYHISNYGNVYYKMDDGYFYKKTLCFHDKRYLGVSLYGKENSKVPSPKKVARLVAEHFVENENLHINADWTVDHIDNDSTNNKASNLRWITRSENVVKSWVEKRKLSDEDVRWIRDNKNNYGTRAMAKMLGVKSAQTISNVLKELSYKYVK